MTQEEKMLLIKDLSARLPYAVTVEHTSGFRGTLHDIAIHHMYDDNDNVYDAICSTDFFGDGDSIYIEYFKPYLFPLSSMTEEQMEELKELCNMYTPDDDYHPYAYKGIEVLYKHVLDDNYKFNFKIDVIDWFNKNHFDYRGLIPMGLAIDATGLNIY